MNERISTGNASLMPVRRPTLLYLHAFLVAIAFIALASSIFSLSLAAQTQPFASSAEYRSMLKELHHNLVRPNRMSVGTLLTTARPPAHLKVEETAAVLRLETGAWRLTIIKNPCRIALTNLQTGLV